MAKFCRYCGTQLEEGQVCSCQQAQAATTQEAAPAPQESAAVATAAPAAATVATSAVALFHNFKDALLCYLKTPKQAAEDVAASKKSLALAGLFAGINALAVFLFIWRLFGQMGDLVTGLIGGIGSLVGGGEVPNLRLQYPILIMLLAGILIAAIGIALGALVLFCIGKFHKQEVDFKKLAIVQAVHTVFPSALLLVGLILSFIAWQLQLVALVLIVILWLVQLCADAKAQAMESPKNLSVQTVLLAAALALFLFIIFKLMGWCFENLAINGISVGDAFEAMGVDNIGQLLGGIF